MSDEETVTCPNCGAEAELIESGTFTEPDNMSVDKIVFDGVARWVEFDEQLVYRMYRCEACDRRVRQIEWDDEIEPPVLVPPTPPERR